MSIKYEPKSLDWTKIYSNCNTTNHSKEDGEPGCKKIKEITDEQYLDLVLQTNKDKWTPYFPNPPGSIVISLPIKTCKMLAEASMNCYLTGAISKLQKIELDNLEQLIQSYLNSNVKYFVRLNEIRVRGTVLAKVWRRTQKMANMVVVQ